MQAENSEGSTEQMIHIDLPAEIGDGEYANLVMIAHSPEEFILDFIRVMPGQQGAKVRGRIILTPAHAKRFMQALTDNVHKYERTNGSIRANQVQQPVPHYRDPGVA